MAIWSMKPLMQERIWGGRNLEKLGRIVPEGKKIGESWELVDRPEAQSVVVETGETLGSLWSGSQQEKIFGRRAPVEKHFPILIKLLDAEEKLSLQVHPPAKKAKQMGGEPKTEMWFFLETEAGAEIYVGLKKGVGKGEFEKALKEGSVSECFHRLKTEPGQAMFLPSGRVHAIGAGNVILEIQQNSDTTYRVDDWGRKDEGGQSRALHVKEALESICWDDEEPSFVQPRGERLLACDFFRVTRWWLQPGEVREIVPDRGTFRFLMVGEGKVREEASGEEWGRGAARFVTADHDSLILQGVEESTVVQVEFS